jgi:ATP-dependent exoDNAse (exonuclease V) beta subunit
VGLLEYLDNVDFAGESERNTDTVQLMTWHAAKGLEWPVVILYDLDDKVKWNSILDRRIVTTQAFVAQTPLANRVVRYLPYVFANNSNPPQAVKDRLDSSAEEQALREASEAQERRLLYVGMTRPRESLVLVVPEKLGDLTGSLLGSLKLNDGSFLVDIPAEPGDPLMIGGQAFACEVVPCGITAVATETTMEVRNRFPVISGQGAVLSAPLLRVSPSTLEEADSGQPVMAPEVIRLGSAFSTPNSVERNVLGEAIHTFLGADDPGAPMEDRVFFAKSVLTRWGVADALKPTDLVEMADRLGGFLKQNLSGGNALRELPIALMRDQSQLHGFIDLIVATDSEVAIIDHKSSYLQDESAERLIRRYSAQLTAYREAVLNSGMYPNRKVSLWLHLPVAGKMVRVAV